MDTNALRPLHSWNVTPQEALQIQKGLRSHIRLIPLAEPPRLIAGADVSMEFKGKEGFASLVLFSFPELVRRESAFARNKLAFPYIPGLLSFREIPLLLEAWEALPEKPDLILVDGQGIAHPRRMGIATHLGILLDVPTIGVAKSVLAGEYEEPGNERGAWSALRHKGEAVGAALRTKDDVSPVFVSPGHLITLKQSIEIVLACDGGYRLPEPTRLAHEEVNGFRRESAGGGV